MDLSNYMENLLQLVWRKILLGWYSFEAWGSAQGLNWVHYIGLLIIIILLVAILRTVNQRYV